ncbi:Fur family transcriptional regulator [Brachybacterium sp. GCM10030252]|uniref:Fur family transcriptional regulator n=1 Tax=Brachybacterium sp. GCM10030252 TaxID=3273380 RepID=UPI00361EA479
MPNADRAPALRNAGLRVTAPRLATLEVVAEHPHADADSVAHAVRERLGAVSRQAVYDVLHALTEVELLRRVPVAGRSARYELHEHDNHHHLECRVCGRLEDVPCAIGEAPCLLPHDDLGFEIEVAEVVYRGVCAACRDEAATSAAATGASASSTAAAAQLDSPDSSSP